jgi:hypothetical protein
VFDEQIVAQAFWEMVKGICRRSYVERLVEASAYLVYTSMEGSYEERSLVNQQNKSRYPFAKFGIHFNCCLGARQTMDAPRLGC